MNSPPLDLILADTLQCSTSAAAKKTHQSIPSISQEGEFVAWQLGLGIFSYHFLGNSIPIRHKPGVRLLVENAPTFRQLKEWEVRTSFSDVRTVAHLYVVRATFLAYNRLYNPKTQYPMV